MKSERRRADLPPGKHDGIPASSMKTNARSSPVTTQAILFWLSGAFHLVGALMDFSFIGGPFAPTTGGLLLRDQTVGLIQAFAAIVNLFVAGGLWGKFRRPSGKAESRDPEESSLQERLTQLCASHPLAPAVCAAHLHAEAAELEEKHAQQRQERRAARRAFLASSAGRRQMGGSAATEVAQPTADEPGLESAEASSARSSSSGDSASWQGPDSLAAATADGWAAEEHAVFLAARSTAGPAGSALVRRLAALLPARSGEQVAAHERWHKEAGRLQVAAQQGEAGAIGRAHV